MKWTKTTDRLPEYSGFYKVCIDDSEDTAFFVEEENTFYDQETFEPLPVTQWKLS